MDTPGRKKKNAIQKREQIARVAFPLLMFIAFVVTVQLMPFVLHALLLVFLASFPVTSSSAIFSTCGVPFSLGLPFVLIAGLVIRLLGPYMQETQRQKQYWLNEYGQKILAPVNRHPEENALVIGRRARGRYASSTVYLHWHDPQTGQLYAFPASTRFSSTLRSQPEGALYPVQFDPDDPSFFDVPLE